MSDDESRREDARIDMLMERALRKGLMGECRVCQAVTGHQDDTGWLCRYCEKERKENLCMTCQLKDECEELAGCEAYAAECEGYKEAKNEHGLQPV